MCLLVQLETSGSRNLDAHFTLYHILDQFSDYDSIEGGAVFKGNNTESKVVSRLNIDQDA